MMNYSLVPPIYISFSNDDEECSYDDGSELTASVHRDAIIAQHEDGFGDKAAASSKNSHAPHETHRSSTIKEHELMWLKLHNIRQQEKIIELTSMLRQFQNEIKALKAERNVSIEKQGDRSVSTPIETNAKLLTDNARLKCMLNSLRKSSSSSGDEDNQTNELLQQQTRKVPISLSERTAQTLPLSSLGAETSREDSTACIDDSNVMSLVIKKTKDIWTTSWAPPPKTSNGLLVDFGETKRNRSATTARRSLSLTEGAALIKGQRNCLSILARVEGLEARLKGGIVSSRVNV